MIVYHGTTMEIQKPDIKHSKAHLDFGVGFLRLLFRNRLKDGQRVKECVFQSWGL